MIYIYIYIYVCVYIRLFSTQCPLHMDDLYEQGATDDEEQTNKDVLSSIRSRP